MNSGAWVPSAARCTGTHQKGHTHPASRVPDTSEPGTAYSRILRIPLLEESMKHALTISCAIVAYIAGLVATPIVTRAQEERLPIIDMHLHAYQAEFIGKQPPNPATGHPSMPPTHQPLRNDSLARL